MMVEFLLVLAALINTVVFARLAKTFGRLRVEQTEHETPLNDLPTVSVCIAARDETHAMTQSLEHVIASDYPKLEVIVLDDGSRDNTSMLIKSFAHAGVRFIEGKPLPEGWLGKNYAQSVLAREASGTFVLFLDVDTIIQPHTISRLIEYALHHNAKMVSIIPMRNDHWAGSTLMATMRHFWAILRFTPAKPRGAANAWLVERQVILDTLVTDPKLAVSVQLVTDIGRGLVAAGEYRLVLSDQWLGVRYEKKWLSQVETSIRLLYPQFSKSAGRMAIGILALAVVILPWVLVWWSLWAIPVIALEFAVAYYYVGHVWRRYRVAGAFLWPVIVLQEIILIIISAYQYIFGTVTWKGRPVTIGRTSK